MTTRLFPTKPLAAITSLLILLLPFSSCFEDRGAPMDEGTLLVYPELVQKGNVPYRDFETFYGPANPWLLSAVYSSFKATITVERSVGLFYRIAILLAVFCLAHRSGTGPGIGATLLAGALLIGTGIAAYAWMGSLACALWCLWIITRQSVSNSGCLVAGMLAGAALLFRADLGPAILLGLSPALFSFSWRQRAMTAMGATIALLPLVLVVLWVGFESVLNNLFIYPVVRSSPGRHIPLAEADSASLRLFVIHVVATGVNLFAGFKSALPEPRARRDVTLLCISLFILGISHQAWQRLDWFHVAFAAFLSVAILPVSLTAIARLWSRGISNTRAGAGGSIVVAGLIALAVPDAFSFVSAAIASAIRTDPDAIARVEKGGRWFPVGSTGTAENIQRLLDRLEKLCSPGERLFVGPANLRRTDYCDTFLYHLMPQLRPATYFLEMNPFSANRPGSRLAHDIESADWVVLNRLWDKDEQADGAGEIGSDAPNALIRERFALVGEYGTYRLFRRKG